MPRKNYKNERARKNTQTRGKKPFTRDKDEEVVGKPTNDPSWYSKYPQLVSDTSSLFFSNPLGARIPKLVVENASYGLGSTGSHIAGVTSLECIAMPGYSDGPSSPVNAIARGIYSYIRHANSGHANYDSPDMMMYLLAMDTCYSFWSTCVRAYGVAKMYNVRSRYLAYQYLHAMGFDADNIMQNLAQFRTTINLFAVRLGSYAVPASMDFFRRHTDMYSKVYLDEPSPKGQTYLFKLWKYYKFYDNGTDGGKLILTDFPSAAMTLDDVVSVMDSLVNPIIGDEDMNIMSGDILKAYGNEGIFKVPMVNESYETPFVYDVTVLNQIENSMAVPTLETDSLGVTQNPANGSILCGPWVATGAGIADPNMIPKKILNLHTDKPSPIDVMEATRLMYSIELQSDGFYHITNFGTELVTGYTVWNYNNSNVLTSHTLHTIISLGALGIADSANSASAQVLAQLSCFNYHPRMVVWGDNANGKHFLMMDIFAYDNYTLLEDSTLANISNTAMLSLFDVGRIALVQ